MFGISPFRRFYSLLFMPVIFGVIVLQWLVTDGMTWLSFFMFGLFIASVTMVLYEWLLDREVEKYRHAIDDALIVFEGSAWAKAYWKLGTRKGRLQREIRRRERAGA